MTTEDITKLIATGEFPESTGRPELIETHISWVLVCKHYVYKLKKPVKYPFLDFSTIDKRKYYCEREVELNRRFSDDMYLDVLPVKNADDTFFIGAGEGEIVDYAVRMAKQDVNYQMNVLLSNNEIVFWDILRLADTVAGFHKDTTVVYNAKVLDISAAYKELANESAYLIEEFSPRAGAIIDHAIDVSDAFVSKNQGLLLLRSIEGFYRDCHGDLHSRNILLELGRPKLFDCIEFNDEFRRIDVLNDVAFLCMDLDSFGREDLSDLFLSNYIKLFPCMSTHEEYLLFVYYKSYRANVRAKVNSLSAKNEKDETVRKKFLFEANRYLLLLNDYIKLIDRELSPLYLAKADK